MNAAVPTVEIVSGSPHRNGTAESVCVRLTEQLELLGARTETNFLSSDAVAGCINCGACHTSGKCTLGGDFAESVLQRMIAADVVVLVTPVYFAGPPAPLKALLDRCQMFWARKYLLGRDAPAKRAVQLVVLGDGGDPFGTQALETICTSALNCAGLRIDNRIERFIGNIPDEHDYERLASNVIADASAHSHSGKSNAQGDS